MTTPRIYLPDTELIHTFWINDAELIGRWHADFNVKIGDQVELFNASREDRLYKIIELEVAAARLELVTDVAAQPPAKEIHLCWPIVSETDTNDIVQLGTTLDVRTFVPILLTSQTQADDNHFNLEAATQTAIRAAELSGRSDIPVIREPVTLAEALGTYADQFTLYQCQQGNEPTKVSEMPEQFGLLVAPSTGWPADEMALLAEYNLKPFVIPDVASDPKTVIRAALQAVTDSAA